MSRREPAALNLMIVGIALAGLTGIGVFVAAGVGIGLYLSRGPDGDAATQEAAVPAAVRMAVEGETAEQVIERRRVERERQRLKSILGKFVAEYDDVVVDYDDADTKPYLCGEFEKIVLNETGELVESSKLG
jgi:hypothetical protein